MESCSYTFASCNVWILLTELEKVTDAVHAKGSFIFLQLWALGRVASPAVLKQEGGFDVIAPSPIRVSGVTVLGDEAVVPRELTVTEIKEYVQLYTKAARNAIEAGFDGVEVHCANGYLLDQFLQSVSNNRTDEYGGSIENRLRFPLEVVNAVVEAVGAERTAIRVSPWSKFQGKKYYVVYPDSQLKLFSVEMGMEEPLPTFTGFVECIRDAHPNFAYIHVVNEIQYSEADPIPNGTDSNDALREAWGDRPYIAAGGFDRDSASSTVEKHGGMIAFGRHFIANVSALFIPRVQTNLTITS
jgi:NADPH2 dehydrogenase